MSKTYNIKRLIALKPDKLEEYKTLHSDSHPGVRHLLTKYNIKNYSIFLHQFDDGKYFLFSYFEYVGYDYYYDMEQLKNEPENQRWWELTDPCQGPLKNRQPDEQWSQMEEVYYNH